MNEGNGSLHAAHASHSLFGWGCVDEERSISYIRNERYKVVHAARKRTSDAIYWAAAFHEQR
eukprot:scaffold74030_cov61-Attheya_sp.AAC.2